MFNPKCSFKIRKKSGVVISKNKRFPCSGIIYIAWTIFLVTWDVIMTDHQTGIIPRVSGFQCILISKSVATNIFLMTGC